MRRISGEIRQSLDFHHMQSGGATVTSAVVTGPVLAIPGFADAVGADIGLPVTPAPSPAPSRACAAATSPSPPASHRPARPASTSFPPTSAAPPAPPAAAAGSSTSRSACMALLLVMAASYVMAGNKVKNEQAQLDAITLEADAAEAADRRAHVLRGLLRAAHARISTVTSLATTRFDWAHALGELSRVLPRRVWLTQVSGSLSATGTGGAASGVRASIPGPAITLAGCTTSHPAVATLMSSLRRMDGVVRVSLDSSQKGNETDSSSSTGDCRGGTSTRTQFTMTIFLEAPVAATAPAPAATAVRVAPAGRPRRGATGASQ